MVTAKQVKVTVTCSDLDNVTIQVSPWNVEVKLGENVEWELDAPAGVTDIVRGNREPLEDLSVSLRDGSAPD